MKLLSALFFTALGLGTVTALAQDGSATKHVAPASKKAAPKKAAKKAEPTEHSSADGDDEDDKVPDVASSTAVEYACELGNKITVYRNADDDKHVALRWQKQILRLKRVSTTTGANRFENRKSGWVWIDIPAKAMLLDAKKGQQLANECRNPEQVKAQASQAAGNVAAGN